MKASSRFGGTLPQVPLQKRFQSQNLLFLMMAKPQEAIQKLRSIYFEALDVVIKFILNRFKQPGYKLYSRSESLQVNAVNGNDFLKDLDSVCDLYGDDLAGNLLLRQLQTLRAQLDTDTNLRLNDVVAFLRKLLRAVVDYFSDVFNLVTLLLFVPTTNVVSERSISDRRRLKMYLRTTVSQER